MRIVKWHPLLELEEAFEQLPSFAKGWDVDVDISEDKENIFVEMHLPGVDAEKIDIEVNENMLRVSGSREEKKEEKDKHFFRKEIRRGMFERTVMLPVPVQGDKAQASFEHGVLKIELPKEKKAQQTTKVQIKTR
jgi:HSP20 family protein